MELTWNQIGINDLLPTAERLLATFPHGRVFALEGEVGSGKTTFVKAICQYLHVAETDGVSSPTYSLINQYQGTLNRQPVTVVHIDLYRLNTLEEALDIGLDDYLYGENLCLIEWPGLAAPLLPEFTIWLRLEVDKENLRNISIHAPCLKDKLSPNL